ncbi:MAG: LapD/MoxY N-terminal periplasmic domain-containing protein [Candidatus Berkiella sp.]
MTLSRQLMLSGMIILLCLFTGMISFVVKNTQSFLNQQLASHSQDTATALGLTLTTIMKKGDVVTASRAVDAVWDRGYYKKIIVEGIDGKPIVERYQQVKFYGVPQWFIKYLPLETPEKTALIMDGWSKVGNIKIVSNPGFAYQQIWLTFIDSVQWFVMTAVLAMILGWALLYIILRPLRAITTQAMAICNQQFAIQETLPWTFDLRLVVEAMNTMSRRLKQLFEEQVQQTEKLREQAFKDPVTKLGNRQYFDLQFDYLLNDKENLASGALV